MDNEIEIFIAALENSTRREILRHLTMEESYALELSRLVGVSQQAVIKHLYLLEQARLISSVGMIPSSSGPARKIYRPQGFSSLIIDYAKNFFAVTRNDIDFDDESYDPDTEDHLTLISQLSSVNEELKDLLEKRASILKKKDAIIRKLRDAYLNRIDDSMTRNIMSVYIETLDPAETAEKVGVPVFVVNHVLASEGLSAPE